MRCTLSVLPVGHQVARHFGHWQTDLSQHFQQIHNTILPSYCCNCPTGCSTEASKTNLSTQWSIRLSSPRYLVDWRFNMKLCITGLCDCRHVLFYYVSSYTELKSSTSTVCRHSFKMDLWQSWVSVGWLIPGKCQSGGIEGMSLFPLVQRFCSEPGQSSLRRCSPCFPWCAPWCTSPD